jgi:hypothetical protein
MSKKFFIVKKILDAYELARKVSDYIYSTGETNPYIFMNRDTLDVLSSQGFDICCNRSAKCAYTYVSEYEGYKVFTDNELSFGEVEIR